MLHGARPRALHHLDHLRRIALLPQPPRPRLPAVPRRNDDHGLRQVGIRRVPGDPDHVVQEPAVKLVLALDLRCQLRGARVHPLLPAPAHQRALQPIRPVHPPVEGIPLQAHARVVRERPAVAVEVFVGLVIVVLLHPHHHAVTDKGPYAAGVRVVRGADPGKGGIVPVLVMIDAFPGPVRILAEGVAHLDHRLQGRQRQGLVGHRHCRHRPGRDFQKLSP